MVVTTSGAIILLSYRSTWAPDTLLLTFGLQVEVILTFKKIVYIMTVALGVFSASLAAW